LPTTTTIITY